MVEQVENKKKVNEEKKADPNKDASPSIEKYFKGVHFPISKKDLVNHARQNSAPKDIVDTLNGLQEKEYKSVTHILKEFTEF